MPSAVPLCGVGLGVCLGLARAWRVGVLESVRVLLCVRGAIPFCGCCESFLPMRVLPESMPEITLRDGTPIATCVRLSLIAMDTLLTW